MRVRADGNNRMSSLTLDVHWVLRKTGRRGDAHLDRRAP